MFDWLNKLVKSESPANSSPATPVVVEQPPSRSALPVGAAADSAAESAATAAVSRMILLDRAGQIIGYEFASRSGVVGARVLDPRHQANSEQALIHAVLGMGASRIGQFRQIWLTVGETLLDPEQFDGFPPAATVILLRPVTHGGPDGDLQGKVATLRALGFRFGLAGMVSHEVFDAWRPQIDVVALDISAYSPDELDEMLALLRRQKPGLPVLARRIDSYEEYEYCLGKGFDLFSGKFLIHRESWPPQPTLHPDRTRLCLLLNDLRGGAELVDIAAGLKLSPELSYRFLRYINSAGMGTASHIGSLEQGVLYLGREKLYRWLTLLLFSGADGQATDAALLEQALVRGRMLELMAGARLSRVQSEEIFVVGVFSLIDMLLRMPLDLALRPLQLPPVVGQALLEGKGLYAPYLELAKISEECESGQAGTEVSVGGLAAELGLSLDQVNQIHVDALTWAQQMQAGSPPAA